MKMIFSSVCKQKLAAIANTKTYKLRYRHMNCTYGCKVYTQVIVKHEVHRFAER